MGAAASVQHLYFDSFKWFQQYIDNEVYHSDYDELDKDHDGAVSFGELQKYIKKKASVPDSPWKMFKTSSPVLMVAHKAASGHSTAGKSRVLSVVEYRSFLIHLLTISVLWVYFHAAEAKDSLDVDTDWHGEPMTFDQFKMAVQMLCSAHAHEVVDDEQLKEDFSMLAVNYGDTVGFISICSYCTRFIDPLNNPLVADSNEKQGKVEVSVPKFFGEAKGATVIVDETVGNKKIYQGMNIEEKKILGMQTFEKRILMEDKNAQDVRVHQEMEQSTSPVCNETTLVTGTGLVADGVKQDLEDQQLQASMSPPPNALPVDVQVNFVSEATAVNT